MHTLPVLQFVLPYKVMDIFTIIGFNPMTWGYNHSPASTQTKPCMDLYHIQRICKLAKIWHDPAITVTMTIPFYVLAILCGARA